MPAESACHLAVSTLASRDVLLVHCVPPPGTAHKLLMLLDGKYLTSASASCLADTLLDSTMFCCGQDQVKGSSDRVSESYASATSGGKTKTAYQKGKDGAASAYAYASDAAEDLGEQAEAAKRAAFGQQKSAWQKFKVCAWCGMSSAMQVSWYVWQGRPAQHWHLPLKHHEKT